MLWWIAALAILFLIGRVFTQTKEINGLKDDLGKMFAIVDSHEQPPEVEQQVKAAPPYRNGAHTAPNPQLSDPRGAPAHKPPDRGPSGPPPAPAAVGLDIPSASSGGGVSLAALAQPDDDLRKFFN